MSDFRSRALGPIGRTRVGIVSTFPPTRCGIGRFTSTLADSLSSSDAYVDLEVVRLVSDHGPESGSPVTMEIDPTSPVGIRAAAKHLSRGDLAIINHEFGIYGDDDGSSVLELVRQLDVPALTILHTVLSDPSPNQRRIIEGLAELTTPVALCQTATDLLVDRYSVPESIVQTIPHGARWSAQPVNEPPRRNVLTWGLLGPGKGFERAIAAIAELEHLDPPVHYRIVGRTHPNVVRNAGYIYRHSLQRLVHDLRLSDRVDFIDRYVTDDELFRLIGDSDLVVVPYDNTDQVSSGVITEAVGMGRPVVATRFPYAAELLGSGAGQVVDHDVRSMAEAIEHLLTDETAYDRAAEEARAKSFGLSWNSVARRYSGLIRRLAPEKATA